MKKQSKKLGSAKKKPIETYCGISIMRKDVFTAKDTLPFCAGDFEQFRIFLTRRDDEKTLTEFRGTGKVVGELTYDDGTSSIEEDRVIIVVRK